LIVDDSRTNRMLLRDMLGPIGFYHLEAVDGQDSLNKYEEYKPDIILMDIAMPIMTGDVAMKTIREREQHWERPTIIIAITASIIRKDIERMVGEGFDAVLMKPFLIDDLFAIIAEFAGIEFVTETIQPTVSAPKQESTEDTSNEALVMYLRILPPALQDTLESDIMGQDFTAIIRHVEQITHLIESTDDPTQQQRLQALHDCLHSEASQENNLFFTKLTDALLMG
jgi:CheY-like chemotaxis protein